MILWITGNSGAGKTTMAEWLQALAGSNAVVLDGDEMRSVWQDLGFSRNDRWAQNLRVARLAKVLEQQGLLIIVATICPYRALRQEVQRITGCKFLYLPGGKAPSAAYPYEYPNGEEGEQEK